MRSIARRKPVGAGNHDGRCESPIPSQDRRQNPTGEQGSAPPFGSRLMLPGRRRASLDAAQMSRFHDAVAERGEADKGAGSPAAR